jgi:hypothetical protein
VDRAITVDRRPDGLLVTIEGRRRHLVLLGFDEAAILAAKLQRHLPVVTTSSQGGHQ